MSAIDPEQHMVIVKTREAWAAQARDNLAILEAKADGPIEHIRDAQPLDPVAFGLMVEALHALGVAAPDLVEAAGLVPVDQAVLYGD